jgi:hypothetical protein
MEQKSNRSVKCFCFLVLGVTTEHLNIFYVHNCMKHIQRLWVKGYAKWIVLKS